MGTSFKRKRAASVSKPWAKKAKPTPYRKRAVTTSVANELGVDLKAFDTYSAGSVMGGSTWVAAELDPAENCLFCPKQGAALNERDGCKVIMKSVYISGYIERPNKATRSTYEEPMMVTLALVLDSQTNKLQLNAEDVYDDVDPDVVPFRVLANSKRFKVLKVWSLTVPIDASFNDAAGTGYICGGITPFSFSRQLNIPVTLINGVGTGDVTDVIDNSLHLIGTCSTSNSIAALAISYKCRVRFIG